jgi:hypothetical protein
LREHFRRFAKLERALEEKLDEEVALLAARGTEEITKMIKIEMSHTYTGKCSEGDYNYVFAKLSQQANEDDLQNEINEETYLPPVDEFKQKSFAGAG